MTEYVEDRCRFHDARSDRHRHPCCMLPWYSEQKYREARRALGLSAEAESKAVLAADNPAELKKLGFHRVRKSQQQVSEEPQRAQPMPLASLLQAFPVRHQRWAPKLVHALLSRSESDLANKSPTEIAGVDVPARIGRDAIKWVLNVTVLGQPGSSGKRSMFTVARTLTDADNTASAVAEWKSRENPAAEIDKTVEAYTAPTFFKVWAPRPARNAYDIPSAAIVAAMNSGYYGSKSQHC